MPARSGRLLVGEVLRAGAQEVLDPVERVALAPAVPRGGLLDPAADLVDALGAQGDDVEDVEHGGGLGQLLIDRGVVSLERAEGGDTDAGGEVFAAGRQPVGVGGPRPPLDQVEQTCPDLPVLVSC